MTQNPTAPQPPKPFPAKSQMWVTIIIVISISFLIPITVGAELANQQSLDVSRTRPIGPTDGSGSPVVGIVVGTLATLLVGVMFSVAGYLLKKMPIFGGLAVGTSVLVATLEIATLMAQIGVRETNIVLAITVGLGLGAMFGAPHGALLWVLSRPRTLPPPNPTAPLDPAPPWNGELSFSIAMNIGIMAMVTEIVAIIAVAMTIVFAITNHWSSMVYVFAIIAPLLGVIPMLFARVEVSVEGVWVKFGPFRGGHIPLESISQVGLRLVDPAREFRGSGIRSNRQTNAWAFTKGVGLVVRRPGERESVYVLKDSAGAASVLQGLINAQRYR